MPLYIEQVVQSLKGGSQMKRLDDWYKTINGIYIDRNYYRSLESIYLHFIEVVTSLNTAGETSRKKKINAELFLPKAIAWFFAYCGRAGIPSVERMIWAKFPGVCPYCRLAEHKSRFCKENDPKKTEISWDDLRSIAAANLSGMPKSLAGWQRMFNTIYTRDENTHHDLNIKRIGEECGECAEAVRVIPLAPQYIICEAPDIFAWLMGFANQFDAHRKTEAHDYGKKLEEEMAKQYPDGCVPCGFSVCRCPAIHPDTLGRIARGGPLYEVFHEKPGLFSIEESVQYFSNFQRGVKIGDQEFKPNDYHKFKSDIELIIGKLDSIQGIGTGTLVELTRILSQLQTLSRQGTLVQSDIDNIIEFVRAQPSPTRSLITDFLVNLSASGTYGGLTIALLEILKRISG